MGNGEVVQYSKSIFIEPLIVDFSYEEVEIKKTAYDLLANKIDDKNNVYTFATSDIAGATDAKVTMIKFINNSDNTTSNVKYTWDFGDGKGISTDNFPTLPKEFYHQYKDGSGLFLVNLRGEQGTESKQSIKTVKISSIDADLVMTNGNNDWEKKFELTNIKNSLNARLSFDFGDNSKPKTDDISNLSSYSIPAHQYLYSGTYEPVATIQQGADLITIRLPAITFALNPIVADFTINSPLQNKDWLTGTITCIDASTYYPRIILGTAPITKHEWTITGSSTISTGTSFTTTKGVGTYDLTYKVTATKGGTDGEYDTKTKEINIYDIKPIVATTEAIAQVEGSTIDFTVSNSEEGGLPTTGITYTWNWDGNLGTTSTNVPTASQTFTKEGKYDVWVSVVYKGITRTTTKLTIYIYKDFTANPLISMLPNTPNEWLAPRTFNFSASDNGDTPNTNNYTKNYYWNIGTKKQKSSSLNNITFSDYNPHVIKLKEDVLYYGIVIQSKETTKIIQLKNISTLFTPTSVNSTNPSNYDLSLKLNQTDLPTSGLSYEWILKENGTGIGNENGANPTFENIPLGNYTVKVIVTYKGNSVQSGDIPVTIPVAKKKK